MRLFRYSQRIPKNQWWLKLRPLLRILAKHDSTYVSSLPCSVWIVIFRRFLSFLFFPLVLLQEEEGMYITVEEECADDAALE